MPRHILFDQVFWEYIPDTPGIAAPLFAANRHLIRATGISYPELKMLYDSMIWIDQTREADEVRKAISEATVFSP